MIKESAKLLQGNNQRMFLKTEQQTIVLDRKNWKWNFAGKIYSGFKKIAGFLESPTRAKQYVQL